MSRHVKRARHLRLISATRPSTRTPTLSIKAMNWVWRHSRSKNGQRLVILAVADCANQDGDAWPSLSELQRKTNLSREGVCDALAGLLRIGELEIVKDRKGPRGQNVYRIITGHPEGSGGGSSQSEFLTSNQSGILTSDADGVVRNSDQTSQESGLAVVRIPDRTSQESGPHNHQEPSSNPQGTSGVPSGEKAAVSMLPGMPTDEPSAKPASEIRQTRSRKRSLTDAPDRMEITPAMRKFAADRGLPPEVLPAETRQFLDWHRSKGNRFADWAAAWRNWIVKAVEIRAERQSRASGQTERRTGEYPGFRQTDNFRKGSL